MSEVPYHIDPSCQAVEQSLRHKNPADTRPTGVGIIYDPRNDKVLLIQPAKADPPVWKFVQGGIESKEGVVDAAHREIGEEVGRHILHSVIGYYGLPGGPLVGGRPRSGKSQKSYYPVVAVLSNKPLVRIDKSEVRRADWYRPAQVQDLLLSGALMAARVKKAAAHPEEPALTAREEAAVKIEDPTLVINSRFLRALPNIRALRSAWLS